MNTDPLLIGVNSVFPNQNSSTAPTVWEEDTEQAAQQGIPCGSGPLLTLTKRSTSQQVLPNGAFNPCPETAPTCLVVENIRVNAGISQRLSASRLAAGLVGGESIGGIPGAPGVGVVGVGAPGDGVRGIAAGNRAAGHGVAGITNSSNVNHAGVMGEARAGGVGVLGQSPTGSGIGVQGVGSRFAVRADGGRFGVVATGTATAVDGRGTGAGTFGVVGVGGVAGVWGGNRAAGGIGVIGVSGPNFVSGGLTFTPFAGRFDGPVRVRAVPGAAGDLSVDGSLFVFGSTKSSVVAHPDGSRRVMHTVEAPESWFEDIGRAQLRDGVARVDIDPDFAAVSGIGDDYHVFLTGEGPSNPLYVSNRTSTGFEVREHGEPTNTVSFSYRIVTRRSDARFGRLETLEPPTEKGQTVDTRLAGRPVSASSEGSEEPPREPDGAPSGRAQAPAPEEAAALEAPTDWPHDTVPWPPEILRYRN